MSTTQATARPKRGTGVFLVIALLGSGIGSLVFTAGLAQNLIDAGSRYGGDGGGSGLMVFGALLCVAAMVFGAIAVKGIGDTIDLVHEDAALRMLAAHSDAPDDTGTNGTGTSTSIS